VFDAGNGQIAFHNSVHNKFIQMSDSDLASSPAASTLATSWTSERFTVVDAGNGKFAFHNSLRNRFMNMGDSDMGVSAVSATLPTTWDSERFSIVDGETSRVRGIEFCTSQTGIWASFRVGGSSNEDLIEDIQTKILDVFETTPVLSAVGFLGDAIGEVVARLLSIGAGFDFYMKGNCNFNGWNSGCSDTAFGLKFQASEFEAYIEKNADGKFAFCFQIKGVWDSCGNNLWENILMLLKSAGEILMKVGKIIGEFLADTFSNCVTAVVDLAEDALALGKIVVDKVYEGFKDNVDEVIDWAGDAAGDVVEWADGATDWMGNAVGDAGNWMAGAGEDIWNAVTFRS